MSLILKTAWVRHYIRYYLTPRGALSPTHDIHIGQVRFILSFRNPPLTLSPRAPPPPPADSIKIGLRYDLHFVYYNINNNNKSPSRYRS